MTKRNLDGFGFSEEKRLPCSDIRSPESFWTGAEHTNARMLDL
jgi:hypothetical protein